MMLDRALDVSCPKCGCSDIRLRYEFDLKHDTIRCACERCRYTWNETPLDRTLPEGQGASRICIGGPGWPRIEVSPTIPSRAGRYARSMC